jgi:DNA-binding transcriptional MerR regulator
METFTDENGQTWTHNEVQFLVCQVASINKAARRLGVKPAQIRKWGIKTSTEWVRDKALTEPGWLVGVIVQQNGRERAAKFLNVSTTFICSLLTQLEVKWSSPRPATEEVKILMVKFGSPILVARMLGTTPNEIKKALPEWKDHRDPTKAGNHSIRTGRIGEDYYEQMRGSHIQESHSSKNHNNPNYDSVDDVYGKVNVKTTIIRNGVCVWDRLQSMNTQIDAFALVWMDEKKVPQGFQVIRREEMAGNVEGFGKREKEGLVTLTKKLK